MAKKYNDIMKPIADGGEYATGWRSVLDVQATSLVKGINSDYVWQGFVKTTDNETSSINDVYFLREYGTYTNFLDFEGDALVIPTDFQNYCIVCTATNEYEYIKIPEQVSFKNSKDVSITDTSDKVQFADVLGRLMCSIEANGISAVDFITKNGDKLENATKKLYGKLAVSLGDSHANAYWTEEFESLSGCNFSQDIVDYIIANKSSYDEKGLMIDWAKALKAYCDANSVTPDIIFIENVHHKLNGVIDDYVPQIYDNVQVHGTPYASLNDLIANIETDLPVYAATLTPTLRTVLRFPYNSYKETMTFSSAGLLTAGTATLTIDGNDFPINVTNGETLSEAITDLNDWSFGDYLTDWNNNATKGNVRVDSIELDYTGTLTPPPEPTITFDAGTTGIILDSTALASSTSEIDYYFNSNTLADFNLYTSYVATNGTNLYAALKGLFQYLQENFKTTEIVLWSPQSLYVSKTPVDSNSYLVETYSGSGEYVLDLDEFNADAANIEHVGVQEAMAEVANIYNIKYINVDKLCSITPVNMFNDYFGVNNVHPLDAGYGVWANTLYVNY